LVILLSDANGKVLEGQKEEEEEEEEEEEIIVTIPFSFFRHPPASTREAEVQFSYLTMRLQSS
jgi:hypothetical protein